MHEDYRDFPKEYVRKQPINWQSIQHHLFHKQHLVSKAQNGVFLAFKTTHKAANCYSMHYQVNGGKGLGETEKERVFIFSSTDQKNEVKSNNSRHRSGFSPAGQCMAGWLLKSVHKNVHEATALRSPYSKWVLQIYTPGYVSLCFIFILPFPFIKRKNSTKSPACPLHAHVTAFILCLLCSIDTKAIAFLLHWEIFPTILLTLWWRNLL